jgi:hypothetical protein
MTNTRPVPNLNAKMVNAGGFLLSPWIQFFQQFVQRSPEIQDVSSLNPYQANQNGTLIITGTVITLTRGQTTIALGNGQKIIPIAIGDSVGWSTASAVQFLGA